MGFEIESSDIILPQFYLFLFILKKVIGLQLLNVVSKLIPNNEYSGDQEIAVDDDVTNTTQISMFFSLNSIYNKQQGNSMAERFRSLYEGLIVILLFL